MLTALAEGAQVTTAPTVGRDRTAHTVSARRHRRSISGRRSALAGFARTSPGRLALTMLVLMLLSVLAGLALSTTTSKQTTQLSTLTVRNEPLTSAAQDLYSGLSEADAAAASAFLAGGLEPADVRERYTRSIDTAAAALGTAGTGADESTRATLAKLSTQLPVYTGLVETARANNQQGFPVGAAYLREASALMQSTLLPAADQLYQHYSQASDQQSRLSTLPWPGVVVGLLALIALVVAQLYVRRRTRRTINVGLLLASLCILVALLWAGTATVLASSRVAAGRSSGAQPLAALAEARILAQQARADETLMLVARGDSAGYEKSFADTTATLTERLRSVSGAAAAPAASVAAEGWSAAHKRVSTANQSGDYPAAVALAVGAGPQDSAAQFTALDDALRDGISTTRQVLQDKASSAQSALSGLSPGVLVLSLLAAVAAAAGMWPRLREFQ